MQCHEIMKSEVECFRETDSIMDIARRMREVNIFTDAAGQKALETFRRIAEREVRTQ